MPIIGLEVQRTETVYSGALHLHHLAEFQASNLSPRCGYLRIGDTNEALVNGPVFHQLRIALGFIFIDFVAQNSG